MNWKMLMHFDDNRLEIRLKKKKDNKSNFNGAKRRLS